MFLRFTIHREDSETGFAQGIFGAAYDLRDSGELEPHEIEWVDEILDWFKRHLPVPNRFRRKGSHGLCWFKAEAGEPLRRIWELVAFLEYREIPVRLHKTRDPGLRVYRDAHQVVAVPKGADADANTARPGRQPEDHPCSERGMLRVRIPPGPLVRSQGSGASKKEPVTPDI
jgi:hypothetical protein